MVHEMRMILVLVGCEPAVSMWTTDDCMNVLKMKEELDEVHHESLVSLGLVSIFSY